MKFLFFYIVFITSHFLQIVSFKEKPQSNIGVIQDSDLTSSDLEVVQEYPEGFEMSSPDICVNLKEMLLAFSANSTDLYATCDYSYQLLGYENKVIKATLPLCYLNIADVFCAYDIVFTKEKFNEKIRGKVVKDLYGCVKSNEQETDENYYKCPGFNKQTLSIEDENKFCNQLESKGVITTGEDGSELEVGEEESRVYTFVKKEEKGKCKIMTSLFNFCIKGYNLLMPKADNNECYKTRFAPYSGSYLKKYNELSRKKCEDFVLPHFLFRSRQMNFAEPGNEGSCENILYDIRKTLNARIEEILQKKQNETDTQELLMKKMEIIEKVGNKSLLLVSNIVQTHQLWSDCYSTLKTFIALNRPIEKTLLKNYKVLKEIVVNSVSTARGISESISSPIFIGAQISENQDYFKTIIEKINSSLINIQSIAETIINLMEKSNQYHSLNENSMNTVLTAEMTENNLDELSNWIVDSKTDYEMSLTAIKNKLLNEKETQTQAYQKSMDELAYYENIRISLLEQKEITSQYSV